MTPAAILPGACVGRWLVPATGRPFRVTEIRWTTDGGQPRIWTERGKRDGSRCVLTYAAQQWRRLRLRYATPDEAAQLDAVAEGWR